MAIPYEESNFTEERDFKAEPSARVNSSPVPYLFSTLPRGRGKQPARLVGNSQTKSQIFQTPAFIAASEIEY